MTVLLLPPKTCISSKGVIVNRRKKKLINALTIHFCHCQLLSKINLLENRYFYISENNGTIGDSMACLHLLCSYSFFFKFKLKTLFTLVFIFYCFFVNISIGVG